MGKFNRWLDKAKRTNLRSWLTLKELDELITVQGTPKLFIIGQGYNGLHPFCFKVSSIAERREAVIEADDAPELQDLLLEGVVISEDGSEKPAKLSASEFIPDLNNEFKHLYRIFPTSLKRDHYLEDILYLNEAYNESYTALQQRRASKFFRRFFGSSGQAE